MQTATGQMRESGVWRMWCFSTLKAFNDGGCEGKRPKVIEASDASFIGNHLILQPTFKNS